MASVMQLRQVLLCVTGLTPQVVTETLYALLAEGAPLPEEIHLITTANGRNRALRDLLSPEDGRFLAFCKEFGFPQWALKPESIHVITDRTGVPLADIRTPEESAAAADGIMRTVRGFCEDEASALHVSIAGGRKTMGFLAGYALSIFGREQDRLSHVLVSEPFENNRDFYFPSKSGASIFARDGSPLNPAEARVSLADIPFIRLRTGFTRDLLEGDSDFSDTVALAQRQVSHAEELVFDLQGGAAVCGGVHVKLPPLPLATYLWFAGLQKAGRLPARPGTELAARDFLEVAARVLGKDSPVYENASEALRHEEDFLPYIQEKRSIVNRHLKKALGVRAARYLIESTKRRLVTRYFLNLEAAQIFLP